MRIANRGYVIVSCYATIFFNDTMALHRYCCPTHTIQSAYRTMNEKSPTAEKATVAWKTISMSLSKIWIDVLVKPSATGNSKTTQMQDT